MRTPTYNAWSQAETDTLRMMIAEGYTTTAIARVMNRTVHAVAKRKELLRSKTVLRFEAWSREDDARLVELALMGMTSAQIARQLGNRTTGAVQYRLRFFRDVVPQTVMQPKNTNRQDEEDEEGAEKHLEAILTANPKGFLAWSEKRVGLRGIAPCAPLFYPLSRAA